MNKKCSWHLCHNKVHKIKSKYCSRKCSVKSAVQRRRIKVKQMAILYKGGKCEICGYNKSQYAIEFHHKDPKQKDFGIAAYGHTKSWDALKIELDKCMILCANCHRETHEKIQKNNQL